MFSNNGATLGGFLCLLYLGDEGLVVSQLFLLLALPYYFAVVFAVARRFSDGEPMGIWPVPAHMVTPHVGGLFIDHYDVRSGTKTWQIPPQQMVHFRRYDPETLTEGMPAVRPIFEQALGDVEAARFVARFNAQAMRPPVAFTTKEELDLEEARELRDELVEVYGGPSQAGKPMLLWSGLTPVQLAATPVEAATIAVRGFTRDEILGAAFGLSKAMLGLTDDVNRATAEAMEFVFARRVNSPKLTAAAQRMTVSILIPFYGEEFAAEFIDVIPGDKIVSIREVEMLAKIQALTKNEARETFGRPPMPDGTGDELAGPATPPRPGAEELTSAEAAFQLLDTRVAGGKTVANLIEAGASAAEIDMLLEGRDELSDAVAQMTTEQGKDLARFLRDEE